MFMFPEPLPIDYYLTDVSQTFLSDGVFYHGKPAPSHKYVAKQLRPIKRTLNDPPAPIQQLDSRHLNRLLDREKEGYVDPCGKDDGMVYETSRWMPKRKCDSTMQKYSFSIFPRSPQYELWYIRDRRLKDAAKHKFTTVECPQKAEASEINRSTKEKPCELLRPPFWWKDDAEEPKGFSVGNINDYSFQKLAESQQDERKISEKLEMDHPKKYIPGAIHRLKNPEDTSMRDALDKADAFKVALRSDETLSKDDPPVVKCVPYSRKHPCMLAHRDSKEDDDAPEVDKRQLDSDKRWQPLYEEIWFSGTDLEREEELRKLTKPFLHELNTWYSKNKPTKLIPPVRRHGKRMIPGRRISHL